MRMAARIFAIVLMLGVIAARAETVLDGNLSQGGLVIGRTDPGTKVRLDGKTVRVSKDGLFLLGFSREAGPSADLRITYPDGKQESRPLTIAPRDWDIQRIDGLPPKQVTPDPETLERIRAENALVAKSRTVDTSLPFFLSGFAWPVEGRVSGVFGSQRILNGEPRSPHRGLDIAAPEGTPVRAFADGVVSLVHPDMFLTGKTVAIDHGLGLNSIYVHMSAIAVTEGQRVRKGDVIGKVGRTGRATGPHLHWGVALFDTTLDPEPLVGPMPAP